MDEGLPEDGPPLKIPIKRRLSGEVVARWPADMSAADQRKLAEEVALAVYEVLRKWGIQPEGLTSSVTGPGRPDHAAR